MIIKGDALAESPKYETNRLRQKLRKTLLSLTPDQRAQLLEIVLGLEAGVDVRVWADPSYTAEQMREIRLGTLELCERGGGN